MSRIDRLIQRSIAAWFPTSCWLSRDARDESLRDQEDVNERSFLDRMNLNAKAYNGEVMFTNEERTLVERAENTETYEEVLESTADVLD